ncbi:MAG: nucleoside monophosphate kinase [Parcubacteria group bacterium]|nr:nucleoside monophosphate kinase [Parcubacteria group bacterium]
MPSLRKPYLIVILGRPGSGKGTQAALLEKKFKFEHLSTGALLRERNKHRDFVGRTLKKVMNVGGLVPTPLVFQLWMPRLERFRHDKKFKGVILDGSPRKLYEARMLDEALDFYGWGQNMIVLNLIISPEEAMKRLLKRDRHDDDRDDIKRRLAWFRIEVIPVLRFYQRKDIRVDIDGERSVETIHKDILRKLKKLGIR